MRRLRSTGCKRPPGLPHPVAAAVARLPTRPIRLSGRHHWLSQAMAMSAFPRMTVKHTCQHNVGQIYIQEVNWLLLGGALLVVGVFETSASIGNAYGEEHGAA